MSSIAKLDRRMGFKDQVLGQTVKILSPHRHLRYHNTNNSENRGYFRTSRICAVKYIVALKGILIGHVSTLANYPACIRLKMTAAY